MNAPASRRTRPVVGVAWPKPDYVRALEDAGAEVRELTPGDALDGCDGLLLSGGPDVDPRAYGATDQHPTVEVDPIRDEYELALARRALEADVPLFAICRGVQVLNVAAGGTLFQDLPTERPSAVPHAIDTPKDAVAHDVAVADHSNLSTLLQAELAPGGRLAVNSRHHQAIREPAAAFVVSATAPDGVIEAIEKPGARFCVGVQWHPENFWRSGQFRALFSGLVTAAKRHRDEGA